ncbi:PREDICTED: box C/D snoRNA protein 1 isoform X1 [Lupinus angustifolius]|uniref:box C/D snoRNA protein 1 isoform X1 n=1 Tax=Lupinus angustifolius TaxID=3871 RepID=UPI00092F8CC1|nr:PREDICTED: box C/D snoRNA protein 1 isoform X1 [Lupinus angustifolius]XP_019461864.1 PREDICTED: box C/D snoRNA protein 1 isoform X1 [Lupinus angustifolius]
MSASLPQMEEQEDEYSTIKSIRNGPTLCEECKSNPSKYKCPGCSIASCSLPCVKSHKARTGCSGVRNQTQFVPLSQFDDNTLLSDYNLLKEMKRVSESARRMRTKLHMHTYFKLPYHLKSLRSAAWIRRTKLMFLPNGMSKREKNQSRYDQRKKFISWTIEWRFHSTDVVLHDHGVNENTNFCSILEKHLKPGPWNHKLRQFCEEQFDNLKLFIRKYPKGPKSPFKELDMKAPIRQQLANVNILEFPVVFVFLPSHRIDFEVIKDANPTTPRALQKDIEGKECIEGVSFREEEIEDDNNSADPRVFDLMKHPESSSSPQMPIQNRNLEQAPNKPLLEGQKVGNLSLPSLETDELKFSEDLPFDFDDESIMEVFDLMNEMDPDDYFNFDFDFAKKTEDEIDLIGSGGLSSVPEEDLEEGEIAE